MKGIVKWYNPLKGYGFITGEDGKDAFVHSSDLPDRAYITQSDSVEYTVEKSERGLKATKVKMC